MKNAPPFAIAHSAPHALRAAVRRGADAMAFEEHQEQLERDQMRRRAAELADTSTITKERQCFSE